MLTLLVLVFLVFLVCVLIRIPIAFAMGISIFFASMVSERIPMVIVTSRMFAGLDSFPMMAIPFFLLAGNVMNASGMTDRLFAFSNCLVGHLRGGLGHVTVVAAMIVAGMSGSALAEAGGLGIIAIKAMRDRGYDGPFSAALMASAATIGPIIPPSIPMVVFGAMVGVSTGRLFLGGIVPGILMGLSLMSIVYFFAKKHNYPVESRPGIWQILIALKDSLWALFTPVIILGGIISGMFTPTEAAAVAALYGLFVSVFVYRSMGWSAFWEVLRHTAQFTAVIMLIIAMANAFGWVVGLTQMPALVAKYMGAWNKLVVIATINILLLILGCLMEAIAILLIVTPIFLPMMMKIGVDPVHFGVFMILNLMIGLLTPPVGLGVYLVSKVADIPAVPIFRACGRFLVPLIIVLILISYFDQLVLFVPDLLMGK
ncbi:MAG TPA: TRAP transporter large permease [Candidatus Methylomirabilis sp.]|nr:TRAP transporter large permease [Candidatus Methylomirabilis sp.]